MLLLVNEHTMTVAYFQLGPCCVCIVSCDYIAHLLFAHCVAVPLPAIHCRKEKQGPGLAVSGRHNGGDNSHMRFEHKKCPGQLTEPTPTGRVIPYIYAPLPLILIYFYLPGVR